MPRLITVDRIRSTNDAALRLARRGVPHGTTIWARCQSAGRGRKRNCWISPPGNVYLSFVADAFAGAVRGECELPYIAGVAAADALRSLDESSVPVLLKWPNDLVVGEKKVGGILVERAANKRFVIGLGINVEAMPLDVGQPVTTLRALGSTATVAAVVECFRQRLLQSLAQFGADGFGPLRLRWLELARDLHRTVEVSLDGTVLRGTLLDVDPDGVAVLGLDKAVETAVHAPTVRIMRA